MAKHGEETQGGTYALVPATFRVKALEQQRDPIDRSVLDCQEEKYYP